MEVARAALDMVDLARKNVTHEKRRLAVLILGISLTIVLMFMQLGLYNSTKVAATVFYNTLDFDAVITSTDYQLVRLSGRVPRAVVEVAQGTSGVSEAFPIQVRTAMWRNKVTDHANEMVLVGFRPGDRPFKLPIANALMPELARRKTALVSSAVHERFGAYWINWAHPDITGHDAPELRYKGRPLTKETSYSFQRLKWKLGRLWGKGDAEYVSPILKEYEEKTKEEDADTKHKIIINGQNVEIVGEFGGERDFINGADLAVSEETFGDLMGGGQNDTVSIVFVKLEPGARVSEVIDHLEAALPNTVKVWDCKQLYAQEENFVLFMKPIGIIFFMALIFATIVGIVILYQIQRTEIARQVKQYATLKAMGYESRALYRIAIRQGFYYALFSLAPGWVLSYGLYVLMRMLTDLPMPMTIEVCAQVFALVLGMCIVSGMVVVRQFDKMDPADLF